MKMNQLCLLTLIVQIMLDQQLKMQQLRKNISTKAHSIITKQKLPSLFKCISKKSKNDEDHKVNKKLYHEDEQIIREPIV